MVEHRKNKDSQAGQDIRFTTNPTRLQQMNHDPTKRI